MVLKPARLLVSALLLLWGTAIPSFALPEQESLRDVALSARALTSQDIASLQKAAESGDARKQNLLGVAYRLGTGVPIDYSKALYWLRRAAEQGLATAQTSLGLMYGEGQGITRDDAEAMKWFRKAAEQNFPDALILLGTMYENGQGVPVDFSEAVRWYRLAAEKGFAAGQRFLGDMYASGKGVPQDYEEAAKWYRIAAEQGDAGAQTKLNTLEKDRPQTVPAPASSGAQALAKAQEDAKSSLMQWVKEQEVASTIQRNEKQAQDYLPQLFMRQRASRSRFPAKGFACSVDDLRISLLANQPENVRASSLAYETEEARKTGYEFAISCPDKSTPQGSYQIATVPAELGKTGKRVFCSDETMSVRFSTDGKAETCFANGTPVPREAIDNVFSGTGQPQNPTAVNDQRWKDFNDAGDKADEKGQYTEAEKQFLSAAREAIGFGPASQQLAISLGKLGTLNYDQKNYSDAELLYWRAINIWDQLKVPSEQPDFSRSLHGLVQVYLAEGKNAEAQNLRNNIPVFYEIKGTVTNGHYTSSDSSFQVALPQLVKPGAIVADRQSSPTTSEVSFRDGFGKIYLIWAYDNRDGKLSGEQLVTAGPAEGLRENESISTSRGRELRIVRVSKGGSFLEQQRSVPGETASEWPVGKLDLVTAHAIFRSGGWYYQVVAGVTPMMQLNEEGAIKEAKENLEKFLSGFVPNIGPPQR